MLGKRSVSAKIQKGTIHLKEFFTFFPKEAHPKTNKPGQAQVGAPLKFQKSKFLKYAKDTIVEILSVSQHLEIPNGIRIRFQNRFFPKEESSNII